MSGLLTPDICVIGAGSGGLSVAAAAAGFGVEVVLVEKGEMGGDCLNTGCVPSKALIAAAARAHHVRSSEAFGIAAAEPEIDFAAVRRHVREVIGAIAPHDSVERFTGLGVRVIEAEGRFTGPDELRAGDYRIRARRFVIATGSSPAVPPVPGLEDVPYLTNETLFDLAERPDHLIIIGGGPIGMEMAQAFRRLGAEVTVLEMFEPLGVADPEAAAIVLQRLEAEGVAIRSGVRIARIARDKERIRAELEDGGHVTGSHLLVAAGRAPNVAGLGLDKAGIAHDKRGITVDAGLTTSNRRIYAIGDVAGAAQFTHMANYHAGVVIRRALFRLPARVRLDAVPWVTYTDPELAHVGLDEQAARRQYGEVEILRQPFAGNDRAIAERRTEGLVKVVIGRRGRIFGATIVGPHAGEIIQPWVLAITRKLPIKAMTAPIIPYPTLSELNKRAAISYYEKTMGNPWLRGAIRFLAKFG